MRRMIRMAAAAAALLLLAGLFLLPVTAKRDSQHKEQERTLRLGYCQSESYYEFDKQLYYLVKGLEEYGLMEEVLKDSGLDENSPSQKIWQYLCGCDQSGWKVNFLPNGFVSMDNLSDAQKSRLREIVESSKANLMITMGTKAGLAVKNLPIHIPLMNFMAADPVGSRIAETEEKSGVTDVWTQVDPDSFTRSLTVMYDIFHPVSIGVVYADNEDAYAYSGAEEIERFCKEHGIEIKKRYVEDMFAEDAYDAYVEQLHDAHAELASGVEVFILTTSLLKKEDFPYVLEPFNEAGTPVYSVNSIVDVENGALMAIEASDYQNIGRFGADIMNQYRKGENLEDLNQIYRTAPFLVLNISTARKIGYQPDFSMLCSANRIYHE